MTHERYIIIIISDLETFIHYEKWIFICTIGTLHKSINVYFLTQWQPEITVMIYPSRHYISSTFSYNRIFNKKVNSLVSRYGRAHAKILF